MSDSENDENIAIEMTEPKMVVKKIDKMSKVKMFIYVGTWL